ncbi:MAG TPA: GNAT family N-acetyltransferase [Acidimicrobiales bacterium]|nr:GNAT family N-acetyltransferase [Acidimicrobiales bacterium]
MEIRRATMKDVQAIAEVHVRSWKAAFCGLLPQDYLDALQPEDRLPGWQDALDGARPWPVVFVGEEDGRIVGFVEVAPNEDPDAHSGTGEVRTIYMDPEAWGGGRGGALLDAGVSVLAAAGFTEVSLWVLHSNSRARRFYERQGWRADGASKEHDWQAFVATDVRYARALPSDGAVARQRPH